MAQIRVALLEPGQEELVAQLHNAAFAEWSESLGPCFRYQPVSAETVTTWMRAPTDAVWVALLGKKAVGYASCETSARAGEVRFLELGFGVTHADWGQSRIGVHRAHRWKGIATRLLRAILDDFAHSGGDVITAASYSFNTAASRLMEKLGFEHHSLFRFPPHSPNGMCRFDAVFAELDLTKPLPQIPLRDDLIIHRPLGTETGSYVRVFEESAPFAFDGTPSPDQIAEWMASEESEEILVAEYDGEVIGIMEYFRDGVIGIPGILPRYRGKGFGTTLFYHLLRRMKRAGHKRAVGDTGLIQEEMMRLYDRFGFDLSKRLYNWTKVLRRMPSEKPEDVSAG